MCAFQVPFTFESTESTPLLSSICLDTDPRFAWCIAQWSKQPVYSLDIETYGEDSFDKGGGLNPWRGKIRLIQIGLRDGLTLVVDLGRHSEPKEPPVHFMEVLQQTLNDPTKLKVGMNFKFDLLWLKKHFGFDARNVADVMHASQLLWAGKERRPMNLVTMTPLLTLLQLKQTLQLHLQHYC
jgi:ribonuclease D